MLSKYTSKPLSWWLKTPLYAARHIAFRIKAPNYDEAFSNTFNLYEDGVGTAHNIEFLKESKFQEAFALTRESGLQFRTYTAVWAARHAMQLEGDFVECGVHRGGYSRAICHILDFENVPRQFWLLDTWSGFAEEQKHLVAEGAPLDRYTDIFEEVKANFSKYPNVNFVRGMVPDTLPEIKSEKIAYLSLDMNVPAAEIAAIEFLWPRLSSGAIVLLDDYNYRGYESTHAAFSDWSKRTNVPILGMPTGQGIIIKP